MPMLGEPQVVHTYKIQWGKDQSTGIRSVYGESFGVERVVISSQML